MSLDDKAIGHQGYSVMSNTQTGKIALLLESCKSDEVSAAVSLFGKHLQKVRSISCDMSAGYIKVCLEQLPDARVVIDKFHVMRYVYDAVQSVRTKLKKELTDQLSKGKQKTESDRQILYKLDVLKRCRCLLTQSPEKWSKAGIDIINQAFADHSQLKTAYDLAQCFKQWYKLSKPSIQTEQVFRLLHQWYEQVKKANLEEFTPVIKMLKKHEDEILNYFLDGHTNARAERLNGQINRFLSNNYGIKDKEFFLYRAAGYFA